MKTAQHNRIEIVSDYEVRVGRNIGGNIAITVDSKTGIWRQRYPIEEATWDREGLEALSLCLNCFRQTGNFKAMRDNEVALFVGGKVRYAGLVREILKMSSINDEVFITFSDGTCRVLSSKLLPLVEPPPKVRPYTPREAVEFLGREMRYRDFPQRISRLKEVGRKHALVAGDQGYETYESLAKHYTWADTGEPCGVIEENTGSFGDRE